MFQVQAFVNDLGRQVQRPGVWWGFLRIPDWGWTDRRRSPEGTHGGKERRGGINTPFPSFFSPKHLTPNTPRLEKRKVYRSSRRPRTDALRHAGFHTTITTIDYILPLLLHYIRYRIRSIYKTHRTSNAIYWGRYQLSWSERKEQGRRRQDCEKGRTHSRPSLQCHNTFEQSTDLSVLIYMKRVEKWMVGIWALTSSLTGLAKRCSFARLMGTFTDLCTNVCRHFLCTAYPD